MYKYNNNDFGVFSKSFNEAYLELQILGALFSLPHFSELLSSDKIHTRKKLSHIEGNDPPRDYPKFEAWDDEDSLIMA
ncbi:hypothetical protein CR513_48544, partial [Mucuna pruriens]